MLSLLQFAAQAFDLGVLVCESRLRVIGPALGFKSLPLGLTLLLSPIEPADLISPAVWLPSRANGTGIHAFGKTMLYG